MPTQARPASPDAPPATDPTALAASPAPTPLKVARAERDQARIEAGILSRLLFDVATGTRPVATASEAGADGWTVSASLFRPMGGEGGLVLIVHADDAGVVKSLSGHAFEEWAEGVKTHGTYGNLPERLVAERLQRERQRFYESKLARQGA